MKPIVKLSLFAVALYLLYKMGTSDAALNLADDTMNSLSPGSWKTSAQAQKYIPYIEGVEAQYGIPTDLLARMAYQESHFRDDIVSGATTSSAGAVGLFQLLPQYFPGAGQNWQADTITAAKYLLQLYNEFQDWTLAVAAYNDGPGNIQAYLAGSKSLPTETQNYVAAVAADTGITGELA